MILFAQIVPLVTECLPLGERDLALGFSRFEIELRRDQRETPLLHLSQKVFDLLTMHQEFPGPERLMIEPVGGGIGGDMAMDQDHLSVVVDDVGIAQVSLAVPERLDLAPLEYHPRLVPLNKMVTESGLPVIGDDLYPGGFYPGGLRW